MSENAFSIQKLGVTKDDMVITNLVFAHNICVTEDNLEDAQKLLNGFTNSAAKSGLQKIHQKQKFARVFLLTTSSALGAAGMSQQIFLPSSTIQLDNYVSHEVSIRIGKATSRMKQLGRFQK